MIICYDLNGDVGGDRDRFPKTHGGHGNTICLDYHGY